MKHSRIFNLCYLGLALVAFSACSSDTDELVVNNDLQNQVVENDVVKTQIAIALPAGKSTRLNGDAVQATQQFLGFEHLYLFSGASAEFTSTTPATACLDLTIGNTEITTAQASKIFRNVEVKLDTKGFMVYAMANTPAGSNGQLNATNLGVETADMSTITFALASREGTKKISVGGLDVEAEVAKNAVQTALLALLNDVDDAGGWPAGYVVDGAVTNLNFLKKLHDDYRTLNVLSSAAVLQTMEDLYNEIEKYRGDNADINGYVDAVQTAISGAEFGADAAFVITGTAPNANFAWNGGLDLGYTHFPEAYNLPDGAVAISGAGGTFATGLLGGTLDVANLTYPASLWYTANTPIFAANKETFTWPVTVGAWEATTAFAGWGEEVVATTNKIALKNTLQYAVAGLESRVKFNSILKDKKGNTVAAANLAVTGVLVGGQPEQLGWDFLSTAQGTPGSFNKTVYDDVVFDGTVTDGYKTFCYTLLCDNKQNTEATEVNVALELQNNSANAIYGAQGKIMPGSKFYLVGKLNTAAAPAGNKEDNGSVATRIFQQDFMTIAKFFVDENGLGNGYSTIPDLRSTQLELGLAVDLTWQDGYSFLVEFK